MSGDLNARDVIARAIGSDQDDTDWSDVTADAVLAALAAAGWRLERDDQSDCSYCGDYLDDGCPVHGGEGEGLPDKQEGPPDDQWEWNVRDRWGDLMLNTGVPKDEATGWLDIPQRGRTLVRRRPAGEWEVAPDA